jgi:DNA repair photolyase
VHYPERADRVLHLLREMRGGRLNDPRFGHRMRGEGPYAALLARRFKTAARRLGLDRRRGAELDTSSFVADPGAPTQAELFT